MSSLKIQLSPDSTICVSKSEKEGQLSKIVFIKEEIVYGGEKGILRKSQVTFTVEEYSMLKLSLPAVDGILNYSACAKQFQI